MNIKKDYSTKKAPTKYVFESLRKDSVYLIDSLIEYGQRKELGLLEKTKIILSYKDKHAELFLTKPAFLVVGDNVKRVTDKIENSDVNELNRVLANHTGHKVKLDNRMFDLLKAELGEFDINF